MAEQSATTQPSPAGQAPSPDVEEKPAASREGDSSSTPSGEETSSPEDQSLSESVESTEPSVESSSEKAESADPGTNSSPGDTQPAEPDVKRQHPTVRTGAEERAYRKRMEEVRAAVEIIRGLIDNGSTVLTPREVSPALRIIGAEKIEKILADKQKRPHRRICQGRAAACHPASEKRYAYTIIAAAKRGVIENALRIARNEPIAPTHQARTEIPKKHYDADKFTKSRKRPSGKNKKPSREKAPENYSVGGDPARETPMQRAFREAQERQNRA